MELQYKITDNQTKRCMSLSEVSALKNFLISTVDLMAQASVNSLLNCRWPLAGLSRLFVAQFQALLWSSFGFLTTCYKRGTSTAPVTP